MTDQQLYISVGIPSVIALIGILVNVSYFVALNGRMNHLESRLDARMDRLDARLDRMESRFEVLIGKVVELYNRLTRVEEQLKHLR